MERVDALIADQGLCELGVALRHIDEVEDDPPFRAHHQIKIPQSDIEVDHADAPASLCERSA